jgi:hypothetical protein
MLETGSGSRTDFGRQGRSFVGFRRGNVANLSAVAFVSRAAAVISMEVPAHIDVDITGELSLGRRPRVANLSSVRLGGVDGLVGVTGLLARMTEGCLPEARNDFAAGELVLVEMTLLLRLGVMGLSGVFALRVEG